MIDFSATPLLVRNVRPIAIAGAPSTAIDVLVDADGRIAATGRDLAAPAEARVFEGGGAYLSPGWTDLHVHIWWGGTEISIMPDDCGLKRGVTTLVDAGSAGQASFAGFRRFIVEPARERVRAFLNIGSIGLIDSYNTSELIDMRSIDIDKIIATVEANRDIIVGIKVRASHVILNGWGITPVKLAKKLGKILKLPLMVHVGEPPPTYDEVLEVLGPGDIVTHCFNGKAGGSIMEDEDLFDLVQRSADKGIRLDIGHGGASFSFKVGEYALKRGLKPFSISTDLHARSLDGPAFDLATTMSKMMSVGMDLSDVVDAVTTAPASVLGLATDGQLDVGRPAEFTIFDVVDADLSVRDSLGHAALLAKMIEPRAVILGAETIAASRHVPAKAAHCPCCGQAMP
ncbi:amidohydrolase/deacetylase family metallohydrolase [Consotaella salsifontis]|uniref:Dihydroorotase n=1 Tax=Consotaella salsifontis TaxID=1365950 RepID=A0A1T4PP29_9HYPH|nr:amidohydrolase/deacetylase family metallohydrolase [Consotaella salsifontis]SJZ93292.1 dihydroorotase [Consotaella salsifontis]